MPDDSTALIVVQNVIIVALTSPHDRLMSASDSSTLELPLD
jgi:hypothetical protein